MFPREKLPHGQKDGWMSWTKIHLAFTLVLLIQAFSNTEKLFAEYFLVFPLPPITHTWTLKINIHFICTTNRSNIKDLGKSNLTRCNTKMGNKVPNYIRKSLSHGVCAFRQGSGTRPQILWSMLQQKCILQIFFTMGLKFEFYDLWVGDYLGRFLGLWHTGATYRRGSHLSQHFVQPL